MSRIVACVIALLSVSAIASAQAVATHDPATRVFRLDGGNSTYVFGVNPRGELQQLYWGGRLAATDRLPQAVPMREMASFDSSYTTTPQEYAGWGAGLFVEPALKATFADGNRDLVLHYASHTARADGFDVVLEDIQRKISVSLHYAIDGESGILARSATVENRESMTVCRLMTTNTRDLFGSPPRGRRTRYKSPRLKARPGARAPLRPRRSSRPRWN